MTILISIILAAGGNVESLYTIYQTPAGKQVYAKVFFDSDHGRFVLQDGANTTGKLSDVKYNVSATKSLGGSTTATTGRWELADRSGYFVFRAPDHKGRIDGYWGYLVNGGNGPPVGSWNGVKVHSPPPAAKPANAEPKPPTPRGPNDRDVTVRFPIIQCVKVRAGFFTESADELYIAIVGLRIKTANGVTKTTEPISARLPGLDDYYLYSSGVSNSRRGRREVTAEPTAWRGRLADGEVLFLSFVFADHQNSTAQELLHSLGVVAKLTGEAGSLAIGSDQVRKAVTNGGKELLDNVDRGDYALGQLSIKIENAKGEVKMSLQGSVEYGKATSSSATTQFFELSGKRNDSRYLAAVSADVE